MSDNSAFTEPHYSVGELAEKWHYGRESVRKIVQFEPGVLKLQLGAKKANCTYSIPASVAQRIHTRLTTRAA